MQVLETFGSPSKRLLISVAAPAECRAVLKGLGHPDAQMPDRWRFVTIGRMDVLLTGVSKSNAAAAVAMAAHRQTHAAVLSLGIAGTYDPLSAPIGTLVASTMSVLVDEGAATPDGFMTCSELGFPLVLDGDAASPDPVLLGLISPLCGRTGPIATVSTCSGTDDLAERYARTCGAIAEGMEGASAGLVAARLGIPFLEVRSISNTTGDRTRQRWDIPVALASLSDLASRL